MSIGRKNKRRSLDDNDDVVEAQEVVFPKFTPQQISEFGMFLDKFRETRLVPALEKTSYTSEELVEMLLNEIVNPGFETIRTININEAAVEFGALSKKIYNGKPCYSILLAPLQTDDNGYIKRYERPTKYDLFFHKYQLWSDAMKRKKYAEGEKMKEYARMADQMADTMHVEVDEDGF